jgi:type I restriction enzyme, R subunit
MAAASTGEYSEDALVEQPTIQLFSELGWETYNGCSEFDSGPSPLGRETKGDVILVARLRPALEKLNPSLPQDAIEGAIEELARDRSRLSPAEANKQVYQLIKDGIKVTFAHPKDGQVTETVRVIDWENPANNDFLLVSQFWVTGDMYTRRADLVGFVNGLPFIFIELKASHKAIKNAYDENLTDYKDTIPHLFWYNALIVLSNGSQSRIGSHTAGWDHFVDWKKIGDEKEEGVISLETMIRGACEQSHLLDIVENFILFSEVQGGLAKMVAKNHQYLGVNNAIEAFKKAKDNEGRLGVFWHTQGSGKSFSMVFFAQKVLRKLPGNYTFVVVTDRKELDGQIYKNFARAGATTEDEIQAESSDDLKRLLKEDHRYIFTLIQKFRVERGKEYPKLSDRSDIIVMTDEAHRSQYDVFAMNMRKALPKASFIGFTGTPLIAGEEKTREVFGDYVSIYNFKQSADDGATVPLYYENRIPELQLVNEELNEDLYEKIEEAGLDEDQEAKLQREFEREYHLITRAERIEKITEDIVSHFMGRGNLGKAMVVGIDKVTAVRMYDGVKKHWGKYLDKLKAQLKTVKEEERKALEQKIEFMEKTDMAVVVSQSQNEVKSFKEKGLDIATHRQRMLKEDMDEKFKDPDDPFRLVFVCAMWMTGFDVPSCSTIYLDKPMKNHTLMQTIARVNRVHREKVNGLIVDYIGVFKNLQKALAIYGTPSGGDGGDQPVQDKQELVKLLREVIGQAEQFCKDKGIDINSILSAEGFDRIKLMDDAVEAILTNEESKKKFLTQSGDVNRLYKAILPDPAAGEFSQKRTLFVIVAEKIRSLTPTPDISDVRQGIEDVLDASIASDGYIIRWQKKDERIDLSKIDFDALKEHFEKNKKKRSTESLKNEIKNKLQGMMQKNKTRADFYEKFMKMIDEYNAGSKNVDAFFQELMEFAKALDEEEKRAAKENLTEEELTIFDLLTRPAVELTKKEELQVKKVAKELLEKLKSELCLDWRKKHQARESVKLSIEEILDGLPEEPFGKDLYQQKCNVVFQHVFESYYGQSRSIYAQAN